MTSPWPVSLVSKFGNQAMMVVTEIKRASNRNEVLAIVEPYDLTEDELAIVMMKMSSQLVEDPIHPVSPAVKRAEVKALNFTKAQFYAACWRTGAAYRQIARLVGVSHQTVHTLAGRVLGQNPFRDTFPITDIQLAKLYAVWLDNPQQDESALTKQFISIIDNWSE